MKLKFKKLDPNAVVPFKAHPSDSGFDLTAVRMKITDDYVEYGTGISLRIPEGYDVKLHPRGSNSKKDLILCNSVGLVDQNYTGEVILRFKFVRGINPNPEVETILESPKLYQIGDRIAQMVLEKREEVELEEVDDLGETDRGEKAFASSGR